MRALRHLPDGNRVFSANNCITRFLLWSSIRRRDENWPGELGVIGEFKSTSLIVSGIDIKRCKF